MFACGLTQLRLAHFGMVKDNKINVYAINQSPPGRKSMKINKFIYWAPRILSIMFLIFLALFSLDIFEGNYGFWGTIEGLFMHNIPVFILLGILIVAWKREIVGGIGFILAGLLYESRFAIPMMRDPQFQWEFLLPSPIIAGPAFLIGILFLIGWFKKTKK